MHSTPGGREMRGDVGRGGERRGGGRGGEGWGLLFIIFTVKCIRL